MSPSCEDAYFLKKKHTYNWFENIHLCRECLVSGVTYFTIPALAGLKQTQQKLNQNQKIYTIHNKLINFYS